MSESRNDQQPIGPGGPLAPEDSEVHPSAGGGKVSLERAVRIASLVALAVLIAFAAIYYLDRYVSTGDSSPLELRVEELEDAVREDPGNPDTRLALAEVYIASERYDDALEQAGAVRDQYPDNDGALLVMGVVHEATDEPEAAISELTTFVDGRKDNEMAHIDTTLEAAYFFLGRSYLTVGKIQEAADSFDAALRISPGDADAMHQGGLAYQALGDHDIAIQYFERATTFVPNFSEVYASMPASYAALGIKEGETYAEAMQLYSAGEYEAALPDLQAVTTALPEFAPAYLGLALTYEQLGDLTAGIEAAQRALEIRPDYLAAEQTLGRLVQQQEGIG